MTRVQTSVTGPRAVELLNETERFLCASYAATVEAEGSFIFKEPLNIFGFSTLLDEIMSILCKYGPDTFYSSIFIKSGTIMFRMTEFGLGHRLEEQIQWQNHFNEKHS